MIPAENIVSPTLLYRPLVFLAFSPTMPGIVVHVVYFSSELQPWRAHSFRQVSKWGQLPQSLLVTFSGFWFRFLPRLRFLAVYTPRWVLAWQNGETMAELTCAVFLFALRTQFWGISGSAPLPIAYCLDLHSIVRVCIRPSGY